MKKNNMTVKEQFELVTKISTELCGIFDSIYDEFDEDSESLEAIVEVEKNLELLMVALEETVYGDREHCHPEADCLISGKPRLDIYEWRIDREQWDYGCSCCNEHSEYQTKFCPNCGAKMHIEEDENGT